MALVPNGIRGTGINKPDKGITREFFGPSQGIVKDIAHDDLNNAQHGKNEQQNRR